MKKTMVLTVVMVLAFCVAAVDTAVADEATNEAIIIRNSAEIWHKGNLDVIDEIIEKNYVRHMPGGVEIRGRDGYREHVKAFRTPFPDYYATMDIMISKGDYVVVRYTGGGTHTGPGMGVPPSGERKSFTANVIHRLAGGKMVECWVELDNLAFMMQLGYKLIPPE